ncbi:hypothetical protein PGT21_027153 [Puccinia graminis f. sp. tritici]|uniref:Uncharacterized protein n=1 Tax=Puccinia graminis f. sp. tritici TaxID=56615 RepID=A0A5B0M4I7_PUCGR|nr:hypothetical protein PGT21_027153 [Puccinia graminis f. sp. tritici]
MGGPARLSRVKFRILVGRWKPTADDHDAPDFPQGLVKASSEPATTLESDRSCDTGYFPFFLHCRRRTLKVCQRPPLLLPFFYSRTIVDFGSFFFKARSLGDCRVRGKLTSGNDCERSIRSSKPYKKAVSNVKLWYESPITSPFARNTLNNRS